MMARPSRWTLVTGQPGSGKTTLVKHLVSELASCDSPPSAAGFVTDEVVDSSGARIGFDVVTVPGGERGVLARKGGKGPKPGAYAVGG